MPNFVIMGNCKDYCQTMCRDLIGAGNIVFINESDHLNSRCARLADRVLYKISRETKISFFRSGFFESYLCEASLPDTRDMRFVFFDSNPHARDKHFLQFLKKKYGAKLILYVINPTSAIAIDPDLCGNFYDAVFTVYARDAEAFGWRLLHHLYSRRGEPVSGGDGGYDTDIFFAGRAKNRLQSILRLYEHLISHGMQCDFHISDVDEKKIPFAGEITCNRWLPYPEMLRRIQRSRCVLEILQRPGEGPTLRMIEAIVYNKKLMTNDANASNNPFYDERFIRIFDVPENLDPGFIRDNTEPDYGYRGEFSAWHLIQAVEDDLAADVRRIEKN